MVDEKLKPCPFCGGQAEFVRKSIKTNRTWLDAVYVRCTICDSRIGRILCNKKDHPNGEEYQIAEQAWNGRVNDGNETDD